MIGRIKIADEAYNNIIDLVCEVVLEELHKKMTMMKEKNVILEEKVMLLELLCKSLQNN